MQWGSRRSLGQKIGFTLLFFYFAQTESDPSLTPCCRGKKSIYLLPFFSWHICKDEWCTLASSRKSDKSCTAGWSCGYSTSSFQPPAFHRKMKFNTIIGEKKLNPFETSQKSWRWLLLGELVVKGGQNEVISSAEKRLSYSKPEINYLLWSCTERSSLHLGQIGLSFWSFWMLVAPKRHSDFESTVHLSCLNRCAEKNPTHNEKKKTQTK